MYEDTYYTAWLGAKTVLNMCSYIGHDIVYYNYGVLDIYILASNLDQFY